MIRKPISLLVASLIFMMSGLYGPVSGSDREPVPAAKPSAATSSKLYKSVAGYMEGMRGGPDVANKISADANKPDSQHRDPSLIKRTDPDPSRVLERERELARLRTQRHEWDLDVSPLERALEAAKKLSDPKEADEIREMLQEAKLRLTNVSQLPPAVRGEVTNSIGMRLVVLPAGRFMMGSSGSERRRAQNEWGMTDELVNAEGPAHVVRITRPFVLGKYEVTAGQFKRFVEETGYQTVAEKQGWGWVYDKSQKHWVKRNGASWVDPGTEVWADHPVTMVSRQDAEAFCQWLSRKDGRRYFLPSEAQWEYAARGGKEGERYPWGNEYPDGSKLNMADLRSPVPWADRTVDDGHAGPAPVGSYKPNRFWLYDMAGNVWEMCSDYYDPKDYNKTASEVASDPTGPRSGKKVVVRGGNWAFGAAIARSAFRAGIPPDQCTDITGFRVAAEALPSEEALEASALETSSPPRFDDQEVSRLMERVKTLVATGKRLEARRLVERIASSERSHGEKLERPAGFVKAVLDAMIDLTQDTSIRTFTNSLGMKMVGIPSGAFVMGSSEADISWAMTTLAQGQPASLENEYPFHKVRLTRPFFISATEVTVGQFRAFVDDTGYVTDAEDAGGGQIYNQKESRFEVKEGTTWKNPGWSVSPDQPVTVVSYNDAQAFVEWLSAKEKLPYKLPTEAQWEYSCRGGIPMGQFPWGDDLPDEKRANYADRSTDFDWRDRNADDGYKYVAPVASYEPNGFGLYDMAGNVLEWVRDYYGEDYYRYTPEIDPEGPGQGENRVTKGGEWTFGAVNLRCAFRGWSRPDLAVYNTGFRVVIETASPTKLVHFAEDFLTRKWVPGTDQRHVAEAVAKEHERRSRTGQGHRPRQDKTTLPEGPLVRGVKILDFSPKSDARKAGLQKGDIIVEYNGARELTADKLIALNAQTRKEKIHPVVVYVREGYQYSVQVSRGFLGISVIDATIRGPFKKPILRESPGSDDRKKSTKPLDWT